MKGACKECSQESTERIRSTQKEAPETATGRCTRGGERESTPEEPRGCEEDCHP